MLAACSATKKNGASETVFSGPVLSCGNASIFQLNEAKDAYLMISLDMNQVEPGTDVKVGSAGVAVSLHKFDGDVSNQPCNDVMSDGPKKLSEKLIEKGTLRIMITQEELAKKEKGEGYRISISSQGLTTSDKDFFVINISDTYVGWLPG